MAKPRIMIGFLHPSTVSSAFLFSMLRALPHVAEWHGWFSGPLLSYGRNEIVRLFLDGDCDMLLTVDADMEFEPSDIERLVADGKDIVGGAYPEAYVDGRWEIAGTMQDNTSVPMGEGLIEVGAVGSGFMLIRRDVLESLVAEHPITQRWPYAEIDCEDGCGVLISEDTTLCFRARELGYSVWMDRDVLLGHQKSIVRRFEHDPERLP